MSKNLIPTLKELETWLTGGSVDNVTYVTSSRKSEAEGVNPNILVDEFGEKPFVTVGVHENAGMHEPEPPEEGSTASPKPVSIAEVAFWNEFGTYRKGKPHIPARSFMASTMDEKREEHEKFFGQIVDAILAGKMTVDKGLQVFGERIQADIQKKITDIKEPANAKSTLDAKYPKTNPLIVSGQMRNAIRYYVGGLKGGK